MEDMPGTGTDLPHKQHFIVRWYHRIHHRFLKEQQDANFPISLPLMTISLKHHYYALYSKGRKRHKD